MTSLTEDITKQLSESSIETKEDASDVEATVVIDDADIQEAKKESKVTSSTEVTDAQNSKDANDQRESKAERTVTVVRTLVVPRTPTRRPAKFTKKKRRNPKGIVKKQVVPLKKKQPLGEISEKPIKKPKREDEGVVVVSGEESPNPKSLVALSILSSMAVGSIKRLFS